MIEVIVVSVLVFLPVFFFCFPFTRVIGDSMWPTFEHGEILWSRRITSFESLQVGKVYVFRLYDEHGYRLCIKRLAKVDTSFGSEMCFFLGDNRDNSYDSREFGWVSRVDIVAKVLFSKERFPYHEYT